MQNPVPIETGRVVLAQMVKEPAIGLVIGMYEKDPLPKPGPYYLVRVNNETCFARYPTILRCPAICDSCGSSKWWWEETFTIHCFVCIQPPSDFLELQWQKINETLHKNPELRGRFSEENIAFVQDRFDAAVFRDDWPEIQRIATAVTMPQRLPELLGPGWQTGLE